MTAKQLHHLKPGDLVRCKGRVLNDVVEGVVLYITADDQMVDAVKLRGKGMLQREEVLRYCVVAK